MNIDTVLFYHLTSEYNMFYCLNSEDSRHAVLDQLLHDSWVLLEDCNWFKQTRSVSYSINIGKVMFYHFISEYSRHYVLANSLC